MFHGFLLAAELGSTRIGGNDLSSGIAGVNGQNDRERKRERERERNEESPTVSKTSHGNSRHNNSMAFQILKTKGKKKFR